jgi:hypothetical protein
MPTAATAMPTAATAMPTAATAMMLGQRCGGRECEAASSGNNQRSAGDALKRRWKGTHVANSK